MSREIKFRVFFTDDKEMLYNDGWVHLSGGEIGVHIGEERKWRKWENYILMQYTGLKDKNGKEIYEGDILDGDMGLAIIIWRESFAQFYAKLVKPYEYKDFNSDMWKDDSELYYNYSLYSEAVSSKNYGLEVIGNIYENPELIE